MVTSQSRVDWDRVHTMVLSDFSLWGTYSGGPIRCETDCCKDRLEPCPEWGGWRLFRFSFKMSQYCHSLASRPNSTGLVEQAWKLNWYRLTECFLMLILNFPQVDRRRVHSKEPFLTHLWLVQSLNDTFSGRTQTDLCVQRYRQDDVFIHLIKIKLSNSEWLKTLVPNKSFS